MIPVVGPIDRPRGQRAVGHDLAPRLRHPVAVLRRHQEGAGRVEEHVHLDPGPAALRERLSGVGGGRALLEDVLRIGDGLAGGLDRRELGREDLLAVQQDVDPVTSYHRPAGVPDERGAERGLRDLEIRQLDVGRDVAAAGQQGEQAGCGEHPECCPHRLRSSTP